MLKEIGAELEAYLQPLKNIHLRSHLVFELGTNSDIKIIYAFSAIAFVILLIACINFMNLSTARSIRRAKEVGMRKVLGAEKRNLVIQFLGESFIYTILSSLLAVGAALLIMPYFKTLSGVEMSIGYFHIPIQFAVLAGIVLFAGLAAGSYPAFFLSSFRPIAALKSNFITGTKSSRFRSILVVFQFALTTILIISTFIIFSQHKYMHSKDLGFNKKDILVVAIQNDDVRSGIESFKNELLTLNGVVSAGTSSMVPGEIYLFNFGVYPEGFVRDQAFLMDNFLVDYGFLDTFEIDVVQGRGFSKKITSDVEDAVMINETAARAFEWSNPIGKTIEIPIDDNLVRKRVIGVFQDIHQRSLYSRVNPTFIQYIGTKGPIENRARRLSLRLEKTDLPATMAQIEQKWKKTFPNHPYYSFFLDEFFDGQHRAEATLGSLFRAFSILAVFIAGLGLFGLASFMSEQRTKEIGIRKVLGSPVTSLVVLLCRKFFFLVAVANIIAWPIAFYIMNSWLQNFPYPASIRINIFIISGVMTLFIAVLSVGHQAYRAAQKNPVESLRFE
jgi:putative ABC transport system permease protein